MMKVSPLRSMSIVSSCVCTLTQWPTNFFSRTPKTESYPAVYKDGALQVSNDGETVNFAIDEANGHLNTGGEQYQRVPTK